MYYKYGNPSMEQVFASRQEVASFLDSGQAAALKVFEGMIIYLARGDVLKKVELPRPNQVSIDQALDSFGFDQVTAAELTAFSKTGRISKELIGMSGSMHLPDLFFEKFSGGTDVGLSPDKPFDACMLLKTLQDIKEAGTEAEYGFGIPRRKASFDAELTDELFYFYSYEDLTLSGNESSEGFEALTELYAFDDRESLVAFAFGFMAGARTGS